MPPRLPPACLMSAVCCVSARPPPTHPRYPPPRPPDHKARKEEREMRFTLEESMAELSELAGTAGLEVAGSTYQRVLEPNPRTYIGTGKVCVSSRGL